jgi:hypothetical protein
MRPYFACSAAWAAASRPSKTGSARALVVSNPLHPDLTAAERLDEVARLLALGFLRLRARRQAEKAQELNQLRNFGLDFGAEGSVCDTDTHADRERP